MGLRASGSTENTLNSSSPSMAVRALPAWVLAGALGGGFGGFAMIFLSSPSSYLIRARRSIPSGSARPLALLERHLERDLLAVAEHHGGDRLTRLRGVE